jgi:hypothetical protein
MSEMPTAIFIVLVALGGLGLLTMLVALLVVIRKLSARHPGGGSEGDPPTGRKPPVPGSRDDR